VPRGDSGVPRGVAVNRRAAGFGGDGQAAAGRSDTRPRDDQAPPLSAAQLRLWFLDRYDGGTGVYNIARATRCRGFLDIEALAHAHEIVAARHEILRTRYPDTDGVPSLVIDPPGPVDFEVVRVAAHELAEYLDDEAGRGFDLSAGPVWRVRLVATGPDDHVLLTVVHHIAADGWSFPVLRYEVGEAYRAALAGDTPDLPPLTAQYRDFSVHQEQRRSTPAIADDLAYWLDRLGDDPDPLPLPSDRPRTAQRTATGFRLDGSAAGTSEALFRDAARELDATPFMVGLALVAAFLSRYARTEDVTIGIPNAERTWPQAEQLIGPFVNSLPIRLTVTPELSLRELTQRVRRTVLEALDHGAVPFDEIVRHVAPRRDASHTPLFQVMYQYRDGTFRSDYGLAGITEESVRVASSTSKFDLLFEMGGGEGPLRTALSVSRDLYDGATARRLLDAFGVFCDAAVGAPDLALQRTPLLEDWEAAWLVHDRNDTARSIPAGESLDDLFRRSAARTPDAVAVVDGRHRLTYADLDALAERIAAHLTGAGIGSGDAVALEMKRSATLIASILAVVRVGAVYVPLDPTYPTERASRMLEAAGVRLVVREGAGRDGIALVNTGLEPRPLEGALDAAYVMFTSGSTGEPKGVIVGQRSVIRLACNTDYVSLGPGDVVAHLSNTAFDAATFEIWAPLLSGGTVVVIDQDTLLSPIRFAAVLRTHEVTTLFVTTAWFNVIAHEVPDAFASVRDVLFGGERCNPSAVRRVLASGRPERLVHVYGPTETTTFASWFEVEGVDPGAETIPIGGPIANTTLYVLDAWGAPLPPLLAGELHVGGPGVALGYVGDATETQRRFIADPFGKDPWGRLYKTGDLVRLDEDGAIEFIGRVDRQVKLRGFRIEPEDVEHALRRHPAVVDAIVRLVGDDDPELVAWVLTPDADVDERRLRAHLDSLLPGYMVPAAILPLREFPINPNGKVDTRSLPAPRLRPVGTPTSTETESRLAAEFGRVLGIDGVGRTDSFFDLGGHSIRAVELVSAIESEFGVRLPVSALFESPTPADLANRIGTGRLGRPEEPLVQMASGGAGPPLFIFHHPSGTVLAYEPLVRHLVSDGPVYGVQALGVDGAASPRRTIEEMAQDYAALLMEVAPTGPLRLAGHSLGGLLAWETAATLRASGRDVALLALLDTKYPYATHREALRHMGHSATGAVLRATYRSARRVAGRVRWGSRFAWYAARREPLPAELARIRLVQTASLAFDRYQPGPLDARVVYFLATSGRDSDAVDIRERWGSLCDGIEIVPVPGTHTGPDSLLAEPHVAVLAAALNERIVPAREAARR
jgi:surfactin family lipopeptide synthetase A